MVTWGAGEQNQLGHRITHRHMGESLKPRKLGVARTKFSKVGAGAFHSFAIDTKGNTWAWGFNEYGQCGNFRVSQKAEGVIEKPTIIPDIPRLSHVSGGSHHSAGIVEADGTLLMWGRVDGFQSGISISSVPGDDVQMDSDDQPKVLVTSQAVPGLKVRSVALGSNHTVAISTDGVPYAWGYSDNYQTGLGTTQDVEMATVVDNSAVNGREMTVVGAGEMYSILGAPALGDAGSDFNASA